MVATGPDRTAERNAVPGVSSERRYPRNSIRLWRIPATLNAAATGIDACSRAARKAPEVRSVALARLPFCQGERQDLGHAVPFRKVEKSVATFVYDNWRSDITMRRVSLMI
jgi:hypothetical protein